MKFLLLCIIVLQFNSQAFAVNYNAKGSFCEKILGEKAETNSALNQEVQVENPPALAGLLTSKALAVFGMDKRMLSTQFQVRFLRKTDGTIFFEIIRSAGKIAFSIQITGQQLYSLEKHNGMPYVVLSEKEGVRAILAIYAVA